MNQPGRRPMPGRRAGPGPGPPGSSGGFARIGVMGIILLAIVVGAVLVFARACSSECNDEYCKTSLDVGPPQGFVFASDVYEFRGTPPELPDGSSIEVVVPLGPNYEPGNSVSFYRFLPQESSWDLVAEARLDEDGEHAIAAFDELPPTVVVMQRSTPAGHASAFLAPGDELHPAAQNRVTMVHTRDLSPAGDGALNGELSTPDLGPDQDHYVVISAGSRIEGSMANVHAVLDSSASRTRHVEQIADFVTNNDLDGVTIAYSELREDQRTSFGLFIEELGVELERAEKGLAVVLPPPTNSAEGVQPGPHDWEVIGGAADMVILLPTRDQSAYRTDMPAILEFLREVMDPRKVALMVTPYAAERSDELRTLTLAEAMQIATRIEVGGRTPTTNENVELVAVNIDQTDGRSGMLWDASTATVAFTYRNDGGRTVWIENQYSVGFKLEFVSAYGLGGFAVEDASSDEFLGNFWPTVVDFIETGTPTLQRPAADDLQPRWEVSGGTVEGGQRGVARWTTPSEPGTYTIRLTLTDGVFDFENEIDVTVEQGEEPEGNNGENESEGE